MRIAFIPVSIVSGLLAGFLGKKIFDLIWSLIDKDEPPEPTHRETTWLKLITALALEGAIFRAVRGAIEHGSRRGFERWTGVWPGEERPESE
jgi:Protein of unknown function (DUF4235)